MRRDHTQHPMLFEISARLWLREHSRESGKTITFANVPEKEIDKIAALGVDLVWVMGVFETGEIGHRIAQTHPDMLARYHSLLDDYEPNDSFSSPYAIRRYEVAADLGGFEGLAVFRRQLAAHGIGLILDFVPNHTALDNPWIEEHPEYYIHANTETGVPEKTFLWRATKHGPKPIACGKDPYFAPWIDTAQLNYARRDTRHAMIGVLAMLAEHCDGVRCDMAMLVLNDIFAKTWKHALHVPEAEKASGEFWAEAAETVRRKHPRFLLLAEAYWDLEWRMIELGFDYAYDKRLLDRLREQNTGLLQQHLQSSVEYQSHLARFLENHDEDRAAEIFGEEQHKAAAVMTFTSPGLRFFFEGQLEGRKAHIPVQLVRRPSEATNTALYDFYRILLQILQLPALRRGFYLKLPVRPAWPGNLSFEKIVACRWDANTQGQILVVVNYSGERAQGVVPMSFWGLSGRPRLLRDLLSEDRFVREGDELISSGLFVDLAPWQAAVYEFTRP